MVSSGLLTVLLACEKAIKYVVKCQWSWLSVAISKINGKGIQLGACRCRQHLDKFLYGFIPGFHDQFSPKGIDHGKIRRSRNLGKLYPAYKVLWSVVFHVSTDIWPQVSCGARWGMRWDTIGIASVLGSYVRNLHLAYPNPWITQGTNLFCGIIVRSNYFPLCDFCVISTQFQSTCFLRGRHYHHLKVAHGATVTDTPSVDLCSYSR